MMGNKNSKKMTILVRRRALYFMRVVYKGLDSLSAALALCAYAGHIMNSREGQT